MPEKAQELQREAARLLDAAKTATDPDRRAAFIHLAATYHELAIKAATDVDAPPTASSGRQGADQQVVPQQQQIQPDN
jgi:hypothetical protein